MISLQLLKRIIRKLRQIFVAYFRRKIFATYGNNIVITKPFTVINPMFVCIEDNVLIHGFSRIEAITSDGYSFFNPTVIIREGTHIESFFHLGCCDHVEIGKNVLIASRVYISDHNHSFSDISSPIKKQGLHPGGKVIIKDNAWLGEGCAILPGVTIGKNSIIGTNAVVTRDVPDYSIAVGVPARVIKVYNQQIGTWERL